MAIVQLTAIAPEQAVAAAQAAAIQPVAAAVQPVAAAVQPVAAAVQPVTVAVQPVAVVASSRSPAMAAKATAKGAPPADAETQAQTVATQPMTRYMIFGVAATAGGIIGGLILQHLFHPGLTKLPVLPAGVGIFALFYVMAQAIERLLVPVSWFGGGFLGGSGSGTKSNLAKKRQSTIVSAIQAPDDGGKAQAAPTPSMSLSSTRPISRLRHSALPRCWPCWSAGIRGCSCWRPPTCISPAGSTWS
jgi:hypothetical protein